MRHTFLTERFCKLLRAETTFHSSPCAWALASSLEYPVCSVKLCCKKGMSGQIVVSVWNLRGFISRHYSFPWLDTDALDSYTVFWRRPGVIQGQRAQSLTLFLSVIHKCQAKHPGIAKHEHNMGEAHEKEPWRQLQVNRDDKSGAGEAVLAFAVEIRCSLINAVTISSCGEEWF